MHGLFLFLFFQIVQCGGGGFLFRPFEAGAFCRQAVTIGQAQLHFKDQGVFRPFASFGDIRRQRMEFCLCGFLQAGFGVFVFMCGFRGRPLPFL